MNNAEEYDAYLEQIIIFIILNDTKEMSNIEIYNKWIQNSNIKIPSGENVKKLLDDIAILKNVDKGFLMECLQ